MSTSVSSGYVIERDTGIRFVLSHALPILIYIFQDGCGEHIALADHSVNEVGFRNIGVGNSIMTKGEKATRGSIPSQPW